MNAQGKSPHEFFSDSRLQKGLRPQIVVDGEEVKYYADCGVKHPEHTRVQIENAAGKSLTSLIFKMSPEKLISSQKKKWGVVIERDWRLTAIVTLIKSAYLTMFHLHGYQWALSSSGIEMGYSLIGRFFREQNGINDADTRALMRKLFLPYKNAIRPIERFGQGDIPLGTLVDNFYGVCFGSSGKPFAQIIYIRIAEECHAVLLPAVENPDSAAIYFEFLHNDKETLNISHTCLTRSKSVGRLILNQLPHTGQRITKNLTLSDVDPQMCTRV